MRCHRVKRAAMRLRGVGHGERTHGCEDTAVAQDGVRRKVGPVAREGHVRGELLQAGDGRLHELERAADVNDEGRRLADGARWLAGWLDERPSARQARLRKQAASEGPRYVMLAATGYSKQEEVDVGRYRLQRARAPQLP